MKRWIKEHQILAFFVLAFALSWVVWIPVTLFLAEGEGFHPLNFVGAFGPFLAATMVTLVVGGWPGMKQWFRGVFRIRIGFHWHLIGWILLPIGVAATQFYLFLSLGGRPDFGCADHWWKFPLVLPIAALFAGGNEEPGWRGFALPKLLESRTPFAASILIGFLWAAWHLPLYLTRGWGGADESLIWFFVNTAGLSVIMTWLYMKSSGSVIPAMLFHQGTNNVWSYVPMATSAQAGVPDWIVLKTIVYWTIAVILLAETRGRLGVPGREVSSVGIVAEEV
jgi:membrane protease YdiL (CAAX protease family)